MDRSRHAGIYNISPYMLVTLIGAGGIGSITAVTLAKMGVRFLEIWDGDRVEPINVATQLHETMSVGQWKVDSTGLLVRKFSDDTKINLVNTNVHSQCLFSNPEIIISAVDSISARQEIWGAVRHCAAKWYLDARMSAEVFQLYVVNLHDSEAWHSYNDVIMGTCDADVPDVVCTEKATFYCADFAAGHVGAAVKRIVTGDPKSYRVVHYIATNTLHELELS